MNKLLAWRSNAARETKARWPYVGNQCDGANVPSLLISEDVLLSLGIARVLGSKETTGTPFELAIKDDLEHRLRTLDPRNWLLDNRRVVSDFHQYRHLAVLDAAVKANVDLRTEFGRDYRIDPDVTIGIDRGLNADPLLHAVVSCKWSMRSDRVQNVRPEGATLVRHRRGRAPHFVVVTCEPLPLRVASIAMTTGEVDAVYHVAFEETAAAVAANGTPEQRNAWDEMVAQRRLMDYNDLARTLALT